MISGPKRSVCRERRSPDFTVTRTENVITSGSMVPALVVLAPRSTMTEERSTAVANRIVRWVVTVIVSWKYGTMYLHSLTEMAMAVMRSFRIRTLIPEWGWSVWLL
ncbi:unknown [Clostridium sp. CAG:277]|nr:unknown [Clostridium sp. CAG:277]